MKFGLVTIETEESKRQIRVHHAERRKHLEAWMAEPARAGKLISGEAFETETLGPVTVRHDSAGTFTVTEGSFAGESETPSGFLLVGVTDCDEAGELAKSRLTGETIEIRPIWVPP